MAPENANSRYRNDFKEIHLLGKGGFGFVTKCQSRLNEECIYAIKCIQMGPQCESLEFMLREASNLARLQHKNVVRYFTAWIERDVGESQACETGKSEAGKSERADREAGKGQAGRFRVGNSEAELRGFNRGFSRDFNRGGPRSSKSVVWESGSEDGGLRTSGSFDLAALQDHDDQRLDDQRIGVGPSGDGDRREPSKDLVDSFWKKATRVTPASSYTDSNYTVGFGESSESNVVRFDEDSSHAEKSGIWFPPASIQVNSPIGTQPGSPTIAPTKELAEKSQSKEVGALSTVDSNVCRSVCPEGVCPEGVCAEGDALIRGEHRVKPGNASVTGTSPQSLLTSEGRTPGGVRRVGATSHSYFENAAASGSLSAWRRRDDSCNTLYSSTDMSRTSIRRTKLYIVMEYVDGCTLRKLISNRLCDQPELAWDLFVQILEGLSYMHKNRLLHRDVKPENIFLKASCEKTNGEKTNGEKTNGEKGNGEKVNNNNEKTGSEKTGSEKTGSEKTSSEKTSGEKTSGEKISGEQIGGGEKTSSGEKTSGVERTHLYQVKIGDLGLSKSLENMSPSTSGKAGLVGLSETTSLSSGVGTHFYIAPEVEAGGRYDQAADIYALGVVFYEMLHAPFGTTMERFQVLTKLQRTRKVEGVSNEKAAQLIAEMLSPDPSERPSAAKLLERCTGVGTAIDFGSVIDRVLENPYSYEMMKVLACLFNRKEPEPNGLRQPSNSFSIAIPEKGGEEPLPIGNYSFGPSYHSGPGYGTNHTGPMMAEPVYENPHAQRLRSFVHRSMRCCNALFYDPPVLVPYNEKCIGWFESAQRFVDTSGSALQPPSCFVYVMKTTLMAVQNATVCRRYTLGYVRGNFTGSPKHPSSPHTNAHTNAHT
ncbi:protein kinase, partial [Gregarina niphandrodes]